MKTAVLNLDGDVAYGEKVRSLRARTRHSDLVEHVDRPQSMRPNEGQITLSEGV